MSDLAEWPTQTGVPRQKLVHIWLTTAQLDRLDPEVRYWLDVLPEFQVVTPNMKPTRRSLT